MKTVKVCTEWVPVEYIEATCPHCSVIDTHMIIGSEGDIVKCGNPKCLKQFKLGEQE